MAIVFYAAPYSSALPVACALNELAVPHERINIDLGSKAQRKPEFLKLNPNGTVPTLVVDGTPMFETLAIVQWLGDRFGVAKKLWPAFDDPARLTALSWTTWCYVTCGAQVLRLNHAGSERSPSELRHQGTADHARNQLMELFGLLDARLAQQPNMLGNDYSLVDSLLSNMVRYTTLIGVQVASLKHVAPWLERCQERPAMRAEWGG
jgi:glutathione S-transferase